MFLLDREDSYEISSKTKNPAKTKKRREIEYFPNFPPSIFYMIFVQIAIADREKFGCFSAKVVSIFLTIHWKFNLWSVIMDYAIPICIAGVRAAHSDAGAPHREETVSKIGGKT